MFADGSRSEGGMNVLSRSTVIAAVVVAGAALNGTLQTEENRGEV